MVLPTILGSHQRLRCDNGTTTRDLRESPKLNCKLPSPQAAKACNLKPRPAPKIDSRSIASGLFTDDSLERSSHSGFAASTNAIFFSRRHRLILLLTFNRIGRSVMRFDVDESSDVVPSRMNGQTEVMLFESPTEVRRDPDVERASVRTRENVNDRPTFHDDAYYTPRGLLGSGKVSPRAPSALGRDDGKFVVSTEARSAEWRDLVATIGRFISRRRPTPACSPPLSRAPCSSRLRP